jgi:hypothetical protein
MTQYELDLQYANNILRIRNALHNEELGLIFENVVNGKRFYGTDIHKTLPIAEILHLGNGSASVITKASIVHMSDNDTALITGPEEMIFNIDPDYTEEKYFQDSLLYSDIQLNIITTINVLHANPLPKYNRFKLNYLHIPLLLDLLGDIK